MLKVKHQRIVSEWNNLKKKNPALAQVVWDSSVFANDNFGKDVIITELYRTQAMQEEYYGRGTERKSPHQYWRAVDIRDSIYTANEISYMLDFLRNYDKYNGLHLIQASQSRTVLRHSIGRGMHFHIQFYNQEERIPPQQLMFTEGMTIVV